MKKLTLVLVVVLAVALVSGCGSQIKTWRPDANPGYVDLTDKKFLVMPVKLKDCGDDALKMATALFAGFVAEFGENGIPLQPIQPALEGIGLGDLSWKLARGLTHAAFFHQTAQWDSCAGEDYSVIPNMIKTLVEKVGELLEKPELKFDYIVVLHVDSWAGEIPKTTNLKVIGGIYDPVKDEIAVAIEWEQTTSEDAMMAEMALLGPRVVEIMVGDNPNKK